jgi:aspartate kinase
MRVLKFGGSSVADAARISQVCSIVSSARSAGPVAVVVSALGGVTDVLAELADPRGSGEQPSDRRIEALRRRHCDVLAELNPGCRQTEAAITAVIGELHRLVTGIEYIGDCPPAVRDRILACGERLSAPLVATALTARGTPAHAVDGAEIIATDSAHGAAAVDLASTVTRSRDRLLTGSDSSTPVVTGFIGSTTDGRTTTLGRGGSDLTATVLGAVLDAEVVEIWTDVNGIFTAPPRVVAGARPQPCVSYDEAAELARFGAAVLFPKTVAPIRERSIPVAVRNTFDPEGPSTWVDDGPDVPVGARSLASVENAVVFKVPTAASHTRVTGGFSEVVSRCLIAALAAASGEWTLVTDEADADSVERTLRDAGMMVNRIDDASVISVVGSRLLQQPWVAGRALEALGRRDIALKGFVSPSEHSVCVAVDRADHRRSLMILHEALMLSHLADQAVSAARRASFLKGRNGDSTSIQRGDTRRDRNRRPTARPPAA